MDTGTSATPNLEKEKALGVERAEAMLKGILIPPRPAALLAVLDEQQKEEPNLNRIARHISSDVALSAATLKVINSPFFAIRTQVTSVYHAVTLLGVGNIVNVITGLMLHSAFSGQKGKFMDAFWASSNQIAMTAAHIARKYSSTPADEAYSIALFLDCGVPLLAKRFPEYERIYSEGQLQSDVTSTTYEDERIGTDHSTVGYLIAKSWKLPRTFSQCILRHHDEKDYFGQDGDSLGEALRLMAISILALHVHRLIEGLSPAAEWPIVGRGVCNFMGVSEADLGETAAEMKRLIAVHGL